MPRLSLPLRLSALLLSSAVLAACAVAPQGSLPSALRSFGAHRAADKPEVISIPSPNQNERPAGAGVSAIILHHTATGDNARQVAAFFTNPKAQVSSHYIVDRSGYIVQPVTDDLRAWHAGKSEFLGKQNVNDFSIGIEICNLGDSVEPYPDAEYDAVIRLVAYLVKQYNLPLTSIARHRDVALPKGRKIDTSDNFSVQRVLDGVKKVLDGTYVPPSPSNVPQPPVPAFKEVTVAAGQTSITDLADIYLDAPSRAPEIQLLNPQISQPNQLKPGQRVKLPTNLSLAFK